MTKKAENKNETKEVTVVERTPVQVNAREGLLLDTAAFEHAYRVARMLMESTMVPEHFRGNVGNCMIALNYAARTGLDPFMVMQKMYVIKGKPAIETQLQVALFNSGKRFTPLKYKLTGKEGSDGRTCIAYATEKSTGEVLEGPEVSIAMAKAEGWYGKSGSKWQTLPELMLRYRAAAFFIRLYSPETTLGVLTSHEVEDIDETQDVLIQPNSVVIDIEEEPKNEEKNTKAATKAKSKDKAKKEEKETKATDPY